MLLPYATAFILGAGIALGNLISLFSIQNHTLPEVYNLPIEAHQGKLQ